MANISLRRKQRFEFYYKLDSDKFQITSKQERSVLQLTNNHTITIDAYVVKIVNLNLRVQILDGFGLILSGVSNSEDVNMHVGLIDPGYSGHLKLICNNKTNHAVTIYPGHLKVKVVAFFYATPLIIQPSILSPPIYNKDVGFDLYAPRAFMVLPLQEYVMEIKNECPYKSKYYTPIILGRSGFASKGLMAIPMQWKGSTVKIKLFNNTSETISVAEDARICQVAFVHKSHIPGNCLTRCFSDCQLSKKLSINGAKVSFIDVKNDMCTSTTTLTKPKLNVNEIIRGENGFGSSGM